MLSPKRTKFRKQHRGRMRGVASKGNTIAFGQFALQAQDCGWVTARQIEASRRAMTRYIKRGGQIWIRIFPDKPVTMRPAETRMGSGKGNPEFWVAVVKVKIRETRPLSAHKRWAIEEILNKTSQAKEVKK